MRRCNHTAVVLALSCLVACDGPPLDGYGCACRIGGVCHAAGEEDADDGCHRCDPGFSPYSWAPAAGCVVTLAGDGTAGFRDGTVSEARFSTPEEVAFDADGRLIVADSGNHRIRVIHQGLVSTLAGSGVAGIDNGPAASATFYSPKGVAPGPGGSVYVSQSLPSPMIRIVTGGQVSTLAGDGTQGFADGPAASARFDSATSLAVDASGQVIVADRGNHRLRRVAAGQVSTFAGGATAGSTDGALVVARFNKPWGVKFAADGRLFVADRENNRIRLVDAGVVSTVAGGAAGFVDGPAGEALLRKPEAVTLDASGAIVFADFGNNAIRRIAGGVVTTLAGDGTAGLVDGPAERARFNEPTGVAVDPAGRIYVGDTQNNCIRVIQPIQP